MTDDELLDAIRAAVAAGASPENAEERVGAPALINTTRARDRRLLEGADIGADEESSDPPLPRGFHNVVYWLRPIDAPSPRIAGIAWDESGSPALFCGVIYPP